ncbi:MAG: hypothetical protein IRZ16_11945 [Myxococcaceae bacterium]|nr:hypothetical protein [Myxococcaceae bacterium]
MKRSQLIALLVLIVAAIALVVLWPKPKLSDEDRIRHQVIQMADAVRRKDTAEIMSHISERFRGSGQVATRDDLKRLLAAQLVTGRWTRVFIKSMDPQVTSPDQATFTGKFIFTDAPTDRPEEIPSKGRIEAYELEGTLEKEADGEWRFVTGRYRTIPPGELF